MSAKKSLPVKPRARKVKAAPKRGRPTAYQAAHAEQARRLALLGFTDLQMAEFFGVAESTFHLWKQRHKDFSESIRAGKAVADAHVAEGLYKAATGGHTVTDTKTVSGDDGTVRTTEVRQVPPSVSAMIFWLKNRQPDKWRDRQDVESSVTVQGPDYEKLGELFTARMAESRARNRRIMEERGLLLDDEGEAP